jgi:hypothetical protein
MVILYVVIGIILLLLILALLLPDSYNVEQSIVIQKPAKDVIDKIADLNYYAQWNPWQMMETKGSMEITGMPKISGHRYHWIGKKTGEGHLTLIDLDNRHVHFNLEFIKPFKSKAKDNWLFEPWGNGETKVTWQNNGFFPFPVGRLMGPMITKNLQKQFRQGLNNLKKMCEGN